MEENAKALDYVETLLDKKAVVKRVKNKNTEILLAGNKNLTSPDVGYMVHMDIVAGRPDQFSLKQKGDRLFGRGVSDMKFSIPLGIFLLNELTRKKSKISFTLAITTDEEIGGFDGGLYLAEKLKFRPKALVVPDGGDNMNFVSKAKGVCQIVVTSKGSPAHASRPWMGKSALEPLAKLLTELVKIYGKNSLKPNWNTTMNVGVIQGGTSVNQVCPEATMKLDFRYPESDSIKKITARVNSLAKKISPDLSTSLASTGLPTFTNTNLPVVKIFLKSMEESYKKEITISEAYGASDARHFAKYKIPVLMMKPMGGEIHSDTEWISTSSCLKFYDGLRLFLDQI